MGSSSRPRTLVAIISYKLARAAGSLVAGVTLVVLAAAGVTTVVERMVQNIHDHAATAVSLQVSAFALSALEPRHLAAVVGALALDTTVLGIEALALWRDWRWAPWFVAVASGALVPFEVAAIIEHVGALRIALLVLNVAIVAYLLVRTWRRAAAEHRAA